MEDILYCKDLHEPILGDTAKPDSKTTKEWETMHRKTVAHIRQWVDQSVFHHVSQESKADVLWKKLESMYERKTAQNKASLIRRLVNLKYRDGKSVTEHLSDFQGLVNQLTSMKMVLDDEMQALLLLSSLPDSWDTLVVSLSNSAPNGKLTMSMVKDSLLNEEGRRKESGVTFSDGEALVSEKHERRGRSHSNGPEFRRDQSRGSSQSLSRKNIKCYYCKKPGHVLNECRKLKKKQAKERGEGKKEDTQTTAVISDFDVVIVSDDTCVNIACQDNSWIIDSGASFHVASRADFFTSYTSGDFGCVRMGNNGASKIVGMGTVCLKSSLGCSLVLKDVRHVPDIRLNLISTGKLDDEGYSNYFGEGKWKLTRGSLVVARGTKSNSLYVMQAGLAEPSS